MDYEIDEKLLRNLNDQLIMKNKEMEQLVAHVAHELLTPITSLLMTADNVLDHYEDTLAGDESEFSDEDLLTFAQRISRNGKDLKDQALNILEYFSNRKLETRTSLLNIKTLVDEGTEDIREQCRVAKIELVVDSSSDRTDVLATKQSVKTIIRNVLGNALKFTMASKAQKNKKIEVKVDGTGSMVNISIQDTGIGMPEEFFISEIFKFGARSKNAQAGEVRGYGLGLTAVKQLLDSLGGSILYTSVVGEGTTVFISIPKDDDDDTFI